MLTSPWRQSFAGVMLFWVLLAGAAVAGISLAVHHRRSWLSAQGEDMRLGLLIASVLFVTFVVVAIKFLRKAFVVSSASWFPTRRAKLHFRSGALAPMKTNSIRSYSVWSIASPPRSDAAPTPWFAPPILRLRPATANAGTGQAYCLRLR